MALANTLSVLLNFKSDLSGLQRFQGFLQGHVRKVEEFNSKLKNGTAALNNALQAGTAFLTIGALRKYAADAIEARQAQAKLNEALTRSNQNTADYRQELGQQAKALQRITGLQDDMIVGVQRQLVFGGAQRKDIADFTRLTLDFAAAKEIDGVSAAKAVARALQGEGDELARYGVVIDASRDKITALKEAMGKFSGQSEQAFASLPAGLRAFTVEAREASQSVGDLALEASAPFLNAMARGLAAANQRMDEMREKGSLVMSTISGIGKTVGEFIGGNLGTIAGVVAAILALKGASMLGSQALALLASGFFALTQQNLVASVVKMRSLVAEIGLLKALSIGGWSGALALGIAGIVAALAGLAVGSVVINSVEAAQLARLDREQRIRDAIYDQTRSLQQQAGQIRTENDAKRVIADTEKSLANTETRYNEQLARKAAIQARQNGPKTFSFGADTSDYWSADDERQLVANQSAIAAGKRTIALLSDPAEMWKIIDRNRAKDAPPAFDRRENERVETQIRLFELETEITRAKNEGNAALEESLVQERDALKLREQLLNSGSVDASTYLAALEAIDNRLEVERASADQKAQAERRERQAKIETARAQADLDLSIREAEEAGNQALADRLQREKDELALRRELIDASTDDAAAITEANEIIQDRLDLEERLRQKARARRAEELALESRLGAIADARSLVDANRFLTDEQKRDVRIRLAQRENAELESNIATLQRERETANPERRGQIDQQIEGYNRKRSENLGYEAQNAPLGMGDSILAGMVQYLNEIPTLAQRAQQAIYGIAQAFSQGVASSITGLINRTMTWRDALLNIGQAVVNSIIASFANMAAQWITQQILMALFGKAIQAAQLAALAPMAAASAMMWAPAATAASIATLGSAALTGAAMAKAAIASSVIGFATGGLVTGPGSGTSDSITARLSNGEFVNTASAVARFGPGFFYGLEQGIVDLSAISGNVARQVPTSISSRAGSSAEYGRDSSPPRVTVINVTSDREATRIARRSRAAGDVVQIVRDNWSAITRRGA